MAKDVPKCPDCDVEMVGAFKSLPPFNDKHPLGSGTDGWWLCPLCGLESEHMNHSPYLDLERD